MTTSLLESLKSLKILNFNCHIQHKMVQAEVFHLLRTRRPDEWPEFWNLMSKSPMSCTVKVQQYAEKLLAKSNQLHDQLDVNSFASAVYKYFDYKTMLVFLPYCPKTFHDFEKAAEEFEVLNLPNSFPALEFRNLLGGLFSLDPFGYVQTFCDSLKNIQNISNQFRIQNRAEKTQLMNWLNLTERELEMAFDVQHLKLMRHLYFFYRFSFMVPESNMDHKNVKMKDRTMKSGLVYLRNLTMGEISPEKFLSFMCCAYEVAYLYFEQHSLQQGNYLLIAAESVYQQYGQGDPTNYSRRECEKTLGNIKFARCYFQLKWLFVYFDNCMDVQHETIIYDGISAIPGLVFPACKEIYKRPLKNIVEADAVLSETQRLFKDACKLSRRNHPCRAPCMKALKFAKKVLKTMEKTTRKYKKIRRKL